MRMNVLALLVVLLVGAPGVIPHVNVGTTTVTVTAGGEARAWNLLQDCCGSGHEMCCTIYFIGAEQGWWNYNY